MPTNQQRREAAKRKLERQQQRRDEQTARRRKIAVITSVAVVVAVLATVVLLLTVGRGSTSTVAACSYPPTSGQPASRPVTAPTNTTASREGIVTVTMATNQGAIPLTLNRAKAPCTVESFVHLAKAGFYNGTPCHRLTTGPPLQVLQCGDPSGTGSGGPGYGVPDEPPTDLTPDASGSAVYPRGTVAMANSGVPNSGGSQFFLVYADSKLPPQYTIFGTINEPGLPVLEKIAAGGDDGSFASGGGKPKIPVTIETVTVS